METKLHTAVRYGNEEHVLQALKEGLDPNQIGAYRWTPLHEAAHNGERDILKLLIFFHGEVNKIDELHGNTPLHYAAQEDNSACVTVLLTAGASLDIKNIDGLTPVDLATSSCKERIDRHLNSQNSTATADWKDGQGNGKPGQKADGKTGQTQGESWEGLGDVPSNAAIGYLHLSFEHHKSNLKVRVWQVSDLLLPPPQTSMIESIFVRSYLIPDSIKKTNRKTEDVRVDTSSTDISKPVNSQPKSGIQHIFTPSSFRFETPLQYTGVTQDIVADRSVQIEVCMTQKHTHKAFLMAMVHMPLKAAVRRPIRQEYPLIPCMNHTIPNNMRVYSARDVFVEGMFQHSVSFSRSNSTHSNVSGDAHLDSVESEIPVRKYISVDISDSDSDADKEDNDDDIDDGIGSSVDVKISSGKESVSPSVNLDMIEYGMDENEIQGHLTQVVSHKTPNTSHETSVIQIRNNPPESRPKKKIIPNELFKTSPEISKKPKPIPSSVIEIEEEPRSTMVDISKLQNDVVLDIESDDAVPENKSIKKPPSAQLEEHTGETPKRKKIIPFESNKTATNVEGQKPSVEENTDNSNFNHKRIIPPKLSVTDLSSNDKDNEAAEDDVAQELESARLQSTSSERSTLSKDPGSTPTPNSRPETPIWDYYDFACDEQAEGEMKSNDMVDESQAEVSDSTSQSDGLKAKSTLQESLARLSRPQAILDTCRVAGPVLPSVIVDDFEMEDD